MMKQGRVSHLTARILALLFAFALWVYVGNEQNPPIEAVFSVPMEVRNVATSLVVHDATETVRIKIRGTRSVLAALQAKDIKAYADMKGMAEGQHTVNVHVELPTNTELVEASPERVQVSLVEMVSRKLPVEVKFSGELAPGLLLEKVVADPEHITLEGPRHIVAAVEKVILPLDLSGKTDSLSVEIVPILLGKDGRDISGVTITPEKVAVSAKLSVGLGKKLVEIKPVMYGRLANGLSLEKIIIKPAQIEITGAPAALANVDFIYTEPVNVSDVSANTEKESKLQFKDGITALQKSVFVEIHVNSGH